MNFWSICDVQHEQQNLEQAEDDQVDLQEG
jgi:hypothetical protein